MKFEKLDAKITFREINQTSGRPGFKGVGSNSYDNCMDQETEEPMNQIKKTKVPHLAHTTAETMNQIKKTRVPHLAHTPTRARQSPEAHF